MNRIDFKLTEDQFILLQHLLPKKYFLKRDTSVLQKDSNTKSLNKKSNQISFTSTESPLLENPPKYFQNDSNNLTSEQSISPETKINIKPEILSLTQSNRQKAKQDKQMAQKKLKQLLIMVLDTIETKKSAQIFLEPVDPIKDNIPQYLTIIKNPMDLKTMRTKVNAKKYKSFDEFKKDIDQIVQNCMSFNAGNDYYLKMGTKFSQDCKSILLKNKEKIQEVTDIWLKINQNNSKNLRHDESINSHQQTSNKTQIKNAKSKAKTKKKNESKDQKDQQIQNQTQRHQIVPSKNMLSVQKQILKEKSTSLVQQKIKISEPSIKETISPLRKPDRKEVVIWSEGQKKKEDKKDTEIYEDKMLKLIMKIRLISRDKKAKFFKQINLVKGEKLDFKTLSKADFIQIEKKFDEFMNKMEQNRNKS